MSARERTRPLPEVVAAALSALVVLGPLLRRGYVLSYDMVFVPEQPLTGQLFGIASFAPRAVPSDLLVALAARVLPADVVQKLVLVAVLFVGCWGAGRALRLILGARAGGRAVDLAVVASALAYLWGPFVYERLVIGQWALLVAWAAMPWVLVGLVGVATDAGARRRRGWGVLVLGLVAAACGSPAGGLLVGAVGVAGLLMLAGRSSRRVRDAGLGALVVVSANAPWLVPSVLVSGSVLTAPDEAGVEAFAARSDTLVGTALSLASGGGIWNAQVVPPGRGSAAVAALVILLLAVSLAGLPLLLRSHSAVRGAVLTGTLGWAAAALGAGPGSPVVRWLVTEVPGGGLLRDTQKLVLPLVLVSALGLGAAVWTVAHGLGSRRTGRPTWTLAMVAAVLPVLTTPSLAWGAAGRLQTVDYPPAWTTAREIVASDGVGGDVLVLPWSLYRRYGWNPGTTLLTPAQRWFDRRAITNDSLPVGGVVVRGEDRRAAALDPLVRRALAPDADPAAVAGGLAEQGVRWVLVERDTGSLPVPESGLEALDMVLDSDQLSLYSVAQPRPASERLPSVGAAAAAFGALVLTAAVGLALRFAPDRASPLLLFSSRRRRHPVRTPERAHGSPET